ncbi:MAG: radical SAM protein [Candidatus Scalinduaceae bacterium]
MNAKLSFENKLPKRLIIFITDRCNLSCKHCFYAEDLNSAIGDLSANDIKLIMQNFPLPLDHVIITGGEPFLNKEVVDIVREIRANSIAIPTNGSNSRIIVEKVKRILQENKNFKKKISVSISIDGPEDVHDKIRGRKGSFDSAMRTYYQLKELEQPWPNFSTGLGATINSINFPYLKVMKDFIWNEIGGAFAFQLVRSVKHSNLPINIQVHTVLGDEEEALREDFCNKITTNVKDFYKIYWGNFLRSRKQIKKTGIVRTIIGHVTAVSRFKACLKTVKHKKRTMDCIAGTDMGVVYSNLDVSFCEFMQPLGNLHDYNYDFKGIWNSQDANRRREIVDKCYCTHTCFVCFKRYNIGRLTHFFQRNV